MTRCCLWFGRPATEFSVSPWASFYGEIDTACPAKYSVRNPYLEDTSMATYALRVNGQDANVTVADPSTPLLYVLEENFLLNGPRFVCGLEQCGECAVLRIHRAARVKAYPLLRYACLQRRRAQCDFP